MLSLASAAALMGALAPAYATSTFHLVVPLSARTQAQEPAEPIVVSLTGAALPKATVSKAYSESLRPYLSVTGDAAFDTAAARWRLADGTLPAGMALDETTGAVVGTPTAKTNSPASFTVLSTYKGSDGAAVYTIEVGGSVFEAKLVGVGSGTTCAIANDGSLKCWGRNNFGQLGDGSTTDSAVPVTVKGLSETIKEVSVGTYHACAVTTNGAAKCWGYNIYGQLGDGTLVNKSTPVSVSGLGGGVTSIVAGHSQTCALLNDKSLKCWGDNGYGQIGAGSGITTKTTPVSPLGLTESISSAVLGYYHTCALSTEGGVKCWGANDYGQLGDASTKIKYTPVSPSGLSSGVTELGAGAYHTCAVTSAGGLKCWGANGNGQLGTGTTTDTAVPVDVQGLGSSLIETVEAGGQHTCVKTVGGAAMCWGRNTEGAVGDGSYTKQLLPVIVSGLTSGVVGVFADGNNGCAQLDTGALRCWGWNAFGQVGDGTKSHRNTPAAVQGFQ